MWILPQLEKKLFENSLRPEAQSPPGLHTFPFVYWKLERTSDLGCNVGMCPFPSSTDPPSGAWVLGCLGGGGARMGGSGAKRGGGGAQMGGGGARMGGGGARMGGGGAKTVKKV